MSSLQAIAEKQAPLLSVQGLSQHFKTADGRTVYALENLNFDIQRGRTVGLVGESGSGKTTAGRAILRLLEPTAGRVLFDGNNVLTLSRQEMRRYRVTSMLCMPNLQLYTVLNRPHGLTSGMPG